MNEKSEISKRKKKGFLILIIGNMIMAIWSTFVFLLFLQVPIWLWIFLNICAPIQYYTCITLILDIKKKTYLSAQIIAAVCLIRYGFMGLFFFAWTSYMITAQISHIIMTITAISIIYFGVKSDDNFKKKKIGLGILIGVIFCVINDLIIFPIVFANPLAYELLLSMGFPST